MHILQILPELQGQELGYIQNLTKDYTEEQLQNFANIYRARRKDPNNILLFTLLGFVVVAGVQRFMVGQIGMGILYLFTGGLCLIGTIVDLINYQDLAFSYNQRMASEVSMMVGNMNR
jgi:TM2 domain-containing membrane protein YozV